MKLTRKQIYVVLIVVGVIALILDRTVFSGGPKPAKGAQSSKAKGGSASAQSTPQQKVRIGIPDFPVSTSARPLRATTRDPFQMTDSAKTALLPKPEPTRDATKSKEPVESFADRHLLSAIIQVGKSRLAILDEEISLAVGQEIESCAVVEITDRSVLFACPDEKPVLRLSGPIQRD